MVATLAVAYIVWAVEQGTRLLPQHGGHLVQLSGAHGAGAVMTVELFVRADSNYGRRGQMCSVGSYPSYGTQWYGDRPVRGPNRTPYYCSHGSTIAK